MLQWSMTTWSTHPEDIGPSAWAFPEPAEWPDTDVIAIGGDLRPATVLAAYTRGIFPMEMSGTGVLGWWSPDPRGILPLEGLRTTRSMRQSAKRYEIRVDTCFRDVMRGCADPSRADGWITDEFIDAYSTLHALGWAHSVEAFAKDGTLAGGLYGIRVNGLFAGESMFHRERDASKVALMALVDLMRGCGMTLLDVQWCTDHLASLGVIEVSRDDYLARLHSALAIPR